MRTETTVSRSKLRRRAASIAIGAALGVVAAAPMAAIIDSGVVNILVPLNVSGVYLNLVTGVYGNTPALAPGWDFNGWGTSTFQIWGSPSATSPSAIVVSSGTTAAALVSGDVVGPANTFVTTPITTLTAFRGTGVEYAGIRFTNEGTGAINYGYLELQTTAPNGTPATIKRYAYDNTGAAITVSNGAPPVAQNAVSRKVQGSTPFDLPLP